MRKSCVWFAFCLRMKPGGNKNINGKINSQKELKKGGKNIEAEKKLNFDLRFFCCLLHAFHHVSIVLLLRFVSSFYALLCHLSFAIVVSTMRFCLNKLIHCKTASDEC